MADVIMSSLNWTTNQLFSVASPISSKIGVSQSIVYYALLVIISLILASLIRTEKDIRWWLIAGGIFAILYFGK